MPVVLQVVLVLWLVVSPVVALVIGVGIARADGIAKIRRASLDSAVTEGDDGLATVSDAPHAGDGVKNRRSATQRHPETKRLHLVVSQRDGAGPNG